MSPTHQDLSNDTTFSQIKSRVPVPLRREKKIKYHEKYTGNGEMKMTNYFCENQEPDTQWADGLIIQGSRTPHRALHLAALRQAHRIIKHLI